MQPSWKYAHGQLNMKPYSLHVFGTDQFVTDSNQITHASFDSGGSSLYTIDENKRVTRTFISNDDSQDIRAGTSAIVDHISCTCNAACSIINVKPIELFAEQTQLCFHMRCGRVLFIDHNKQLYEGYKFDQPIIMAKWSQGRTYVATISEDQLNLYICRVIAGSNAVDDEGTDQLFEDYNENSDKITLQCIKKQLAHPHGAGSHALQTVGWGSRVTQFQGQAGKQSREKEITRTSEPMATQNELALAWHKDERLAINIVNQSDNFRYIYIFDRFGDHMSTVDPVEYLQSNLAAKHTSESTFFVTACKDNVISLTRFEYLGKVREHTRIYHRPPTAIDAAPKLIWNDSGDVLAIAWQLNDGASVVDLYTISRAKLYCEVRLHVNDAIVMMTFLNHAGSYLLVLVTLGGVIHRFHVSYRLECSIVPDTSTTIAYKDGNILYMSALDQAIVPPPAASMSITLPESIVINAVRLVNADYALLMTKEMNGVDSHMHTALYLIRMKADQQLVIDVRRVTMSDELIKLLKSENFHLDYALPKGNKLIIINMKSAVKINKEETCVDCIFAMIDVIKAEVIQARRYTTSANPSPAIAWIGVDTKTQNTIGLHVASALEQLISYNASKLMMTMDGRVQFDNLTLHMMATSCAYHPAFIIFTAYSNETQNTRLYTIPLSTVEKWTSCSQQIDESLLYSYSTFVDNHSRVLVACGERVTLLGTVRGDYTTLYPRPMLIYVCGNLMDSGNYIQAANLMARNRIPLFKLIEHDPSKFQKELASIARDAEPRILELLLQDTFSWQLRPSSEKEEKMLAVTNALPRCVQDILLVRVQITPNAIRALVCAYIMKHAEPAEILGAMQAIIKITKNQNAEQLDKAVQHLSEIVRQDHKQLLYDYSLLTRDRQLIITVAECLHLDPQEYEPEVQKVLDCDEHLAAFRINVKLMRYADAMKEIFQMEPEDMHIKEFESALVKASASTTNAGTIVSRDVQKKVFEEAMSAFSATQNANRKWLNILCEHYAKWQITRLLNNTGAAQLYMLGENFEKALQLWEKQYDWKNVEITLHLMGKSTEEIDSHLRKIFASLTSQNNHEQAVELALQLKDDATALHSSIVMRNWRQAALCASRMPNRDESISKLAAELIDRCEQLTSEELPSVWRTIDQVSARLRVLRQEQKMKIQALNMQGCNVEDADLFSEASIPLSSMGASTAAFSTATKRNKHKKMKAQMKRLDLKVGSKWEQLALLNHAHQHYEQLNKITAESQQIIECAFTLPESTILISCAQQLARKNKDITTKAYGSTLTLIWPDKWTSESLPAPIEELYCDDTGNIVPPASDDAMPSKIEFFEQMRRPNPPLELTNLPI